MPITCACPGRAEAEHGQRRCDAGEKSGKTVAVREGLKISHHDDVWISIKTQPGAAMSLII